MDQLRVLIPHFSHERYLWFYCRKALFQVIMPILLALMSICDFVKKSNSKHDSVFGHLYFYTSSVLFLYVSMSYILKYIFSIFSEKIILRKEINLMNTVNDLILDNTSNDADELSFIISKRIFKARYSQSPVFQSISKLCWLLGIDSPILIPHEILLKLSNSKTITRENEQAILRTTLVNLCTYHPTKYNPIPSSDGETINVSSECIVTPLDRTISDIQLDLFNKKIESNTSLGHMQV